MDKYSTTLSKRDKEILSRSLSSGGMTRRQAMKWLIAMGVSVVAANSLVAKLGEAATETPKRGGRIRAGGQSTTASRIPWIRPDLTIALIIHVASHFIMGLRV